MCKSAQGAELQALSTPASSFMRVRSSGMLLEAHGICSKGVLFVDIAKDVLTVVQLVEPHRFRFSACDSPCSAARLCCRFTDNS